MKVLHVTQGYYPAIGGTELLIQRVSEQLVQQFGDEVTVFTTNCTSGEGFYSPALTCLPQGWEKINGVQVRRFPVSSKISRIFRLPQSLAYHLGLPGNQYLRALAGGPIIPGLRKAIREHRAEVVAASSFPLLHMFSALQAAQATGRPCILHGGLHPQDAWGFERPMIYRAIRKATRYIANTEYEARYVIDRGASPDRVIPIGVGVDLEPFERVSSGEAKARLGLEGKTIIGFIGQLGGHKGVDTLVRAMPLVWKVFPETHFLIAGARVMYTEQLEMMVQQLPEQDQGKVKLCYNFAEAEKPWLYAAVDIFAYPSGFESFGIAFLEAWACRKPVIGCRRGAIPWVVRGGQDGLLVEYQKEAMLAEGINLLLANPGWASALGENGYQKVKRRFAWPAIARRFREVYLGALESFRIKGDS